MSNETQSLRSRLFSSYNKLNRCRLVRQKDLSDDSLNFFVACLNDALPKTDADRDQMRIVKDLHYTSSSTMFKLLNMRPRDQTQVAQYILWTNAWSIVHHFQIENLIKLNWDKDNSKYLIEVLETSDEQVMPKTEPDNFQQQRKQVTEKQTEKKDGKRVYQTPRQLAGKDKYSKKNRKQNQKGSNENKKQTLPKKKTVDHFDQPDPTNEPDVSNDPDVKKTLELFQQKLNSDASWADD